MLTINKQRPDIERGVNVGNDDFDVGAGDTLASTYSTVSGENSISTSLEKILIDCAHQRKNDDFRWLRPDGETQVQTIPKQVLRIQLQPREQIVEVPIVLHFEQLVQKSTVLIAEAVVQVLRVDIQYVDKECFSSHGGDP